MTDAIRNIRPAVIRSALVMRLSKLRTMMSAIVPAALPGIMTGIRIGVSTILLNAALMIIDHRIHKRV